MADIHDRFVKAQFGQIDLMKDFLKGFLPGEIARALDFESLSYVATERIGASFRKTHLDLALSGRLSEEGRPVRIYLLLEHKSRPDPGIFLQLVGYMAALWEEEARQGSAPTPILPFVLYHGEGAWALSRSYFDHMGGPDILRPYALDFSPLVLDVGKVPDQTIRESVERIETVAALLTLKHVLRDSLQELVRIVEPFCKTMKPDQQFKI